jgi:hypothetical protein
MLQRRRIHLSTQWPYIHGLVIEMLRLIIGDFKVGKSILHIVVSREDIHDFQRLLGVLPTGMITCLVYHAKEYGSKPA